MSVAKSYTASDYAGIAGGQHEFYFGYEQVNDNEEWLFIAKIDGKKVMQYTADDLDMDQWDDPAHILMKGVAKYFEMAESPK